MEPTPEKKPDIIRAPFTPEQVTILNLYQVSDVFHPYECDREDSSLLVAHEDGWHCPNCDYTQNWAHPITADRSVIESAIAEQAKLTSSLLKNP